MIGAVIAAIFFLVSSFIFFVLWAVGSFILGETYDAIRSVGESTIPGWAVPSFLNTINQFAPAFGIICAIFFLCGILMIFAMRALSGEDEYYYVRR